MYRHVSAANPIRPMRPGSAVIRPGVPETRDVDSAGARTSCRDAVAVHLPRRGHAWAAKEGLVRPTGFGLPGEVGRASVTYAQQGEHSGFGWRLLGGHVGFTFVQAAQKAWEQSVGFQFLAGAVGAPRPCESQRRALLAADLLSHSILSHRPAGKVISVVRALEALLLPRNRDSQTFRLARSVAFFGCGLPEGSLCGRDRPTCMDLANDPAGKADRAALTEWQARADADPRWRCSEWEAALDLYATRSALVHGEDRPVDLAGRPHRGVLGRCATPATDPRMAARPPGRPRRRP